MRTKGDSADIDLVALKAEYITGRDSYKTMAKKHNVSLSTLQRAAAEQGWFAERQQYRIEAVSRAVAAEQDNEVDRLRKLMQATEAIQDVVIMAFGDGKQFNRHLVQTEVYDPDIGAALKDTVERVYDKVDTKAIKDLTGAIRDLTYSVRNLYGLPTQAEREQQRIAAERLNMDKRKAESDETADKTIHVVMLGAEEYAK